MKWCRTKNYAEMSQLAAERIVAEITKDRNLCLALPTGGTPIGTLEQLVELFNERKLDYSGVRCFNIDEYIALGKEHPQGYYYFLNHYLYSKTNFDLSKAYVPNVFAEELTVAAQNYEETIAANGYFDLILLGIGEDGHIGFNEPNDCQAAACHVADLAPSTIEANARFFEKKVDVPTQAITLGMGTILKSKKILLIANGQKKAAVMAKLAATTKVDPAFPASYLLLHPDVTIICDAEACEKSEG